jgi:hypothetical protein
VPQRFALPPVITASTWRGVWSALWSRLQQSRGVREDSDGTVAPSLTNREAAAVVRAVRQLARKAGALVDVADQGFPSWYQYAAIAYGWSPDNDQLDVSKSQADRMYDADAAVMLQQEVQTFTGDLDDARVKDPRIDLEDVFDWSEWKRLVAEALAQDGARALFKIPIPACKDPKTGKPAKPVRDPKTGKWTCPGGGFAIDPIKAIVNDTIRHLVPIVLVAIAISAVMEGNTRRSRKRR